jgi:hypothetical protein
VRPQLLAAQRRDEVAALRWSVLSSNPGLDAAERAAKNSRTHPAHTAPKARAALAASLA